MQTFKLELGGINDLDLIAQLWMKLIQHHLELEPHFKDRFLKTNWEQRKKDISAKAKDLNLAFVRDPKSEEIIAYCISTTEQENEKQGEIDSIFIEEAYRKSGIGEILMKNACDWLDSKAVATKKIRVSGSNESVIEFYKKFNFHPLYFILQQA